MGLKCRPIIPLPNNRQLANGTTSDVIATDLYFLRVRLSVEVGHSGTRRASRVHDREAGATFPEHGGLAFSVDRPASGSGVSRARRKELPAE
jgi:hypothetical protein